MNFKTIKYEIKIRDLPENTIRSLEHLGSSRILEGMQKYIVAKTVDILKKEKTLDNTSNNISIELPYINVNDLSDLYFDYIMIYDFLGIIDFSGVKSDKDKDENECNKNTDEEMTYL
jgi:hypothetical protein